MHKICPVVLAVLTGGLYARNSLLLGFTDFCCRQGVPVDALGTAIAECNILLVYWMATPMANRKAIVIRVKADLPDRLRNPVRKNFVQNEKLRQKLAFSIFTQFKNFTQFSQEFIGIGANIDQKQGQCNGSTTSFLMVKIDIRSFIHSKPLGHFAWVMPLSMCVLTKF